MFLIIQCMYLQIFEYGNIIISCNTVPYSYLPHVLLLHILYMKYINCIINCNIVPYSYFPHVLLLHILYMQLQTLKYINSIINCNIVPYSYFPHVLSLYILCIQLQTVKCINCIINCNIVPHSYFPYVLSLHILYINLRTLKCINCIIKCNIVPYSYFPHVLLLHILYIQLQTVKNLNCIVNCKATSCMPATNVHALPCACRQLAFLWPTWQRPSCSKMTSQIVRRICFFWRIVLKFGLGGVERRSEHGIFQSLYQLGEFQHHYNELRKISTKFFECCRMSPSTFWLYSAGYTRAHFTQLNKFSENNICGRKTVDDAEVSPTCYTFEALYSVPWWSQFGSQEDRYIHNDSNTLLDKIIHVARLM